MSRTSSSLPVRVGVFSNMARADLAVNKLLEANFDKHQITVICPNCDPHKYEEFHQQDPAGAHTPHAAAGGSAIGAVLGGLVALAGIAATGGVGLLVAGPLLAGAGGGAVAGGFIGAMLTRGFENEVADYYDQAVQRGKVLVSVEVQGEDSAPRLALAESILHSAGAEPIALPEG